MKAEPNEEMCFAVARPKGRDAWERVTLGRQPFIASRGVLEDMAARMAERFPEMEYKVERANHA